MTSHPFDAQTQEFHLRRRAADLNGTIETGAGNEYTARFANSFDARLFTDWAVTYGLVANRLFAQTVIVSIR